jgi:hypothetical protein
MLIKTNNEFMTCPHITLSLSDECTVTDTAMRYFDKEGYEVNALEQLYYIQNAVPLGRHLNHTCCQMDWVVSPEEPVTGPFFDHCMILMRWDYQEQAREQITAHATARPVLNKLLKIRPKWGVDASLDYLYEDGEIMEMFHIETDRYNLEEIVEVKRRVEQLLFNTDWHDAAKAIRRQEDKWRGLNADDQGDWKCQFFGLGRSYDNLKVL